MRFQLPLRFLVASWYLAGAIALIDIPIGPASGRSAVRRNASAHHVVARQVAGREPHGPHRRVAARPQSDWAHDLQAVPPHGAFCRFFHVRATAYMPRRAEGGRYTFTERDGRAAHGVAVDPHIIPLGTRLWVPGYGNAIADDTGSAIQGHHIDIRVQERYQETAWGARQLRVYILQDPD